MPTLIEYFKNDFKDISIGGELTVRAKTNGSDDLKDVLIYKREVKQDMNSSCRLFTFYIPEFDDTYSLVKLILLKLEDHKKDVDGFEAIGSFMNDVVAGTHISTFSNRIYFYTETQLNKEQVAELDQCCKELGLYITLRSTDYLKTKMETEKPLAFISHDSKDKDLIARNIANGLNSRLCIVWYDEFSMSVGHSLRESIEKGIKEAKKCVLVLTPHFLSNPGWTKKEFNSIFTKEMIFNEKIILPVWFNVTKEEVFEYSPALADTVALMWPNPEKLAPDVYSTEVEKLISKLHTAITQ